MLSVPRILIFAVTIVGEAASFALTPSSASASWRARPASLRHRCGARTRPILLELVLTEENVQAVLDEAERDLGTMFGSNPESAAVGITGRADLVELDGPTVVIRLSGRFWHARARVLERLEAFVLERIPECIGVEIEDPSQLEDALDPATGLPVNEVPGIDLDAFGQR